MHKRLLQGYSTAALPARLHVQGKPCARQAVCKIMHVFSVFATTKVHVVNKTMQRLHCLTTVISPMPDCPFLTKVTGVCHLHLTHSSMPANQCSHLAAGLDCGACMSRIFSAAALLVSE